MEIEEMITAFRLVDDSYTMEIIVKEIYNI